MKISTRVHGKLSLINVALAVAALPALIVFQNCSKATFKSSDPASILSQFQIDTLGANDVIIPVKLNEPKPFSISDLNLPNSLASTASFYIVDSSDSEIKTIQDYWGKLEVAGHSGPRTDYSFVTNTLGTRPFSFKIIDNMGHVAHARVIFSTGNPLLSLKPALAVRNTACIFCHSSVKGNVITDFGFEVGRPGYFFGNAVAPLRGQGIYNFGNSYSWRSSDSLSPNFIEGTMFVPRREISSDKLPSLINQINISATTSMRLLPNFPNAANMPNVPIFSADIPKASIVTMADYSNAVLNHRTPEFLSAMRVDPVMPKAPDINPDTNIREISELKIGAPTAVQLREIFGNAGGIVYRRQGDNGAALKNFSAQGGGIFGNLAGDWMECDGDLFVDGIVYLNQLKLRTKFGCRIYSTHTVFMSAVQSTKLNREGIEYDLAIGGTPHLQITSARAIVLGAGKCSSGDSLVVRAGDERTDNSPTLNGTGAMEDYSKMVDGVGRSLLYDIGDCAANTDARRSVNISHVLLNAPAIHSRFAGDVSGVLIAGHMVGSLGRFSYRFDPVFEKVTIFPQIPSDWFFSAQDCATYDPNTGAMLSDQSLPVAGEPKYRSCFLK